MDYRRGLTELKSKLQANHSEQLLEFSTLEARLLDNLNVEQKYGTTETTRTERARVVAELNRLAFDTVGISFNDLCTKSSPRSHSIPTLPQPYFAHPYPLQANFTGRIAERQMLTDWLTNDERPILVLVAIGGMGKSSLSWYWLQHDVDPESLDGILWWSFYEGEASFTKFLDEVLVYISQQTVDPASLPSNYDKARTLVNLLQQHRILLVLDGFERQLRAYASLSAAYQRDDTTDETADARACIDPNAARLLRDLVAGPAQVKVLITTRLMVHNLEDRLGDSLAGCRKEELRSLQPDDAVNFMHAQGVTKGTHAEIIAVCEAYGYHPLSLRLLSGLVTRDKRKPGDITAAPRYDVHTDLVARQHHVLEAAYNLLSDELRLLLSRIAAFRTPMTYDTLTIFNEFGSEAKFDSALDELIERSLVFFDVEQNRYDLHPIVRAYAYDRLVDRKITHVRLRDYFAAIPTPDRESPSVDDLAPVIELYHHCTQAEFYNEAFSILRYKLNESLYIRHGEYILFTELVKSLFPLEEGSLPYIENPHDQAWLLNKLALCYIRTGKSHLAVSTFEKHISVREAMDYRPGIAVGLGNLSEVLIRMGRFKEASETLKYKISLCDQIGQRRKEIIGRQDYGLLLAYQGEFEKSCEQLDTTRDWLSQKGEQRLESVTWAYDTILQLLQGNYQRALEAAKDTRRLVKSEQRQRDIIRAEWLLGWAYNRVGHSSEARQHLSDALIGCRRINLVELEPDILLAWARWHYASGNVKQAQEYADEALSIANRCEYRLKQADIHNFLAQWELGAGNTAEARQHAEIAKERAWCDGPPHCYKPALDEAERLLQEIAQYS